MRKTKLDAWLQSTNETVKTCLPFTTVRVDNVLIAGEGILVLGLLSSQF